MTVGATLAILSRRNEAQFAAGHGSIKSATWSIGFGQDPETVGLATRNEKTAEAFAWVLCLLLFNQKLVGLKAAAASHAAMHLAAVSIHAG